ncbi:MAG: Na/Pi cotransporter family protein [Oscillospiraceae bacterium]|nr:Na/Pi cotransporter family protein [Oscillospiraceae bacterium]
MDLMEILLPALGGLGLFLFGMKIMSGGLELVAGDRMQSILQRATANRFLAVIVGIVATVALNSSTAATIMTVSFVNSSLMTLTQAIGIIMGANVGTTFSAQLIAFRVDSFAPLFIFVGILMHLFVKKRSIKNIGQIILGFGLLFFGISVLGGPFGELRYNDSFREFLINFDNPVLALLAGFVFTAVVQSSTATTGILVGLHVLGVPISFETSAFIILGTNIGTSITTLIASIPANRNSKRAAVFHIMFDIIGSTVFGTLIFFLPGILHWFEMTWYEDTARQVAMFHTLYNVATMMFFLPFVNQAALLMQKIIPIKTDEIDTTYEKKLLYLDTKIMQTPSVAVLNAHQELCRMGRIANENLTLALKAFFEKSEDKAKKTIENEDIINYLNHNIAAKLVWINNMPLSNSEAEKVGRMFRTLSDIERIGDHAENIAEYTLAMREHDLKFSEAAMEELRTLSYLTQTLVTSALDTYEHQNETELPQIGALEEEVDKLSAEFSENHITRLKAEKCEPKIGVVFTDMIIDLERSADHANNIAFAIVPERTWSKR